MLRFANGEHASLPLNAYIHLVAARYGLSPEQVRDWAADDFADAMNFLGITK